MQKKVNFKAFLTFANHIAVLTLLMISADPLKKFTQFM